MYKYCPHCGKPFLEPDKPRTVGLVSQVKEFITWAQIKEWSDLREASKHFEIGDEIYDELKTGEPITLVVVEKDKPFDGDVMFMLKDCLRDTYPMNDDYTNAGGWKASELRKVLNTEILALLPDDMRAAIKPRVIDGESDLLWLASEMEVFGPHDWTENDPDRGEQMTYYKRRGNRIKSLGDEGEAANNWWERSPGASGAACLQRRRRHLPRRQHLDWRGLRLLCLICDLRIPSPSGLGTSKKEDSDGIKRTAPGERLDLEGPGRAEWR
jgi:hypothetical protein